MPGLIYAASSEGALRQGEIITDLVQVRLSIDTVEDDEPEVEFEIHPFAIILSQDCDLDQDWKARQLSPEADPNVAQRLLPSVLFAQLHLATDLKGRVPGSELWRRVRQNKEERYHFLEEVTAQDDALGQGLPELGVDFKRYFSLPAEEVYKRIGNSARRRCRLISPYLEHLSTRFCYFQFRVALPMEHQST